VRAGDASVLLRARDDSAIPAGATRSFELRAPANAEVVLERRDPRSGEQQRLAPEPTGAGR
jgi:hypothetical protein